MYKTQYAQVKSIIKEAKSDYYASEIEQCGRQQVTVLFAKRTAAAKKVAPNDNMHGLAASFLNFFCVKIDMICVALCTQSTLTSTMIIDQHPTSCVS